LSNTAQITKVPTSEFYKKLDECVNLLKTSRDVYHKALEIACNQGFTEEEADGLAYDYLHDKVSRTTLWRIRKNKELVSSETDSTEESTSTKQQVFEIRQIRVSEAIDELMEIRRQGVLLVDFYCKGVKN
jgi:hypothetical protein